MQESHVSALVSRWLTSTIQQLVDRPNRVAVEAIRNEKGFVFRVDVAPKDLGKVIGMNGGTAAALRHLLRSMAVIYGKNFALDLVCKEAEAKRARMELVRERKNKNAAAPLDLSAFTAYMLAQDVTEEEPAYA